jgi:hypothetical protein
MHHTHKKVKIIVLYILFLHITDPKNTRTEELGRGREERRRLLRKARAQKGAVVP